MNAPCANCFTGTLRGDVVPRGREEIIYGLPTYVTFPDPGVQPLGTVVIISDAFGWKLLNTRALADVYAQRVPCIVYVPDFMNGLPSNLLPATKSHTDTHPQATPPPQKFMILSESKPPPTASLLTRLMSKIWTDLRFLPLLFNFVIHNRASVVQPRITNFIHAVRNNTVSPAQSQPGKLAVAGFCWGGPYTIRLTHDTPENKILFNPSGIPRSPGALAGREFPVIDCAFTAHPSLLKIPEDIEGVSQPLSVANGDDDQWMGRKKMELLVKIIEGKNKGVAGGDVHEVQVYPGARHGFAVRGDREDPMQRERGWRSEDQAVRWFRRHFGGGGDGR